MMFRIPESYSSPSSVQVASPKKSNSSITSRSWSRFSGPYCPTSLIQPYSNSPSCGANLCYSESNIWDVFLCTGDTDVDLPTTVKFREIGEMRTSELKEELEAYGVATRGLFEKVELEEALRTARTSLPRPDIEINSKMSQSKKRESLLASEREKVQQMKSSEIRTELKETFQITTIFFEKSEYIDALVTARVEQQLENKENSEESSPEVVKSSIFSPFTGISNTMQNIQTISSLMQNVPQLLKNPKAAAIVQKYQSNPRVMRAVMDCMQCPANFSKYQADAEVTEFLTELGKCV